MTYIKLANVTKIIKKRIVLDNISLELDKGKIYGFRGINGSGKTMLFRSILGLITLNHGSVIIEGQSISKETAYPINTGILIEHPAFIGEFSAYKNLKLLASLDKKIPQSAISDVLTAIGLDPTDNRKTKSYSLGMKQKLGIAQAFLSDPDLLILDEPTNALDETSIDCLVKTLIEMNQEGKTILIASHDSTFLKKLTNLIYTLENGSLKE